MTLTTINGKPVEQQGQGAPATAPSAKTHHADCGDVGQTGEHGEIGSNAVDAKERQTK